ncbi:glycyl-radical enzyme activating protein [Edaphovirga cremea]|uniref:glycyl-radical enzyme activating protein n=1 Tax=Edaphovirga cremea TaxID=2267246 RepID=UPI000DEF77DA|nr:glycyl-radical enzyme activating protein [Edaphovirga cremea]
MIFNLQRYSTHDGPGIRTVVFLKGCSLGCRWCQNPESRSRQPQILFDARLCISGCRLCCDNYPHAIKMQNDTVTLERQHLTEVDYATLGECCPSGALSICGEVADVDQIMQNVLRDLPFYQRSGGGVTISGGEPFMQPELYAQLLERCRQHGIHTAVETCLHVPWSYISPSLDSLDLLLADLKHVDGKRFAEWTEGSAKRVMDNFRRLARADKEIIIRVPLIPDFNADHDSIRAIVNFAADETGCREIHFLPYHTLGINKYSLLGMPYLAARQPLDNPDLLAYAQQYAADRGLTALLRG